MAKQNADAKLNLGKRLQDFRHAGHYSQAEIAMILGIERSTYSYYESGKTVPIIFDLTRLASLYGITVDRLVSGGQSDALQALHDSGKPLRAVVRRRQKSLPVETLSELSSDERQLLGFYRSASAQERAEILQMLFDHRRSKRQRGC